MWVTGTEGENMSKRFGAVTVVIVAAVLVALVVWAQRVEDGAATGRAVRKSRNAVDQARYDEVFNRELTKGGVDPATGTRVTPQPQDLPSVRERALRAERDAAVAEYRKEYREAAHLRELYDLKMAVGQCVRMMPGPCDCSVHAVSFVRAMQGEERMSMTRRRRLDASWRLAELCLGYEEGVTLSDYLR